MWWNHISIMGSSLFRSTLLRKFSIHNNKNTRHLESKKIVKKCHIKQNGNQRITTHLFVRPKTSDNAGYGLYLVGLWLILGYMCLMAQTHCTGPGVGQGTGNETRNDGFLYMLCNVHTTQWQGQGHGTIVFYCAHAISCAACTHISYPIWNALWWEAELPINTLHTI